MRQADRQTNTDTSTDISAHGFRAVREKEKSIEAGGGRERERETERAERERERERVLAEKVIRQSFQSALSDFNLCGGNEFPRFGFQVPGLHATYDTTCQPEENLKTF